MNKCYKAKRVCLVKCYAHNTVKCYVHNTVTWVGIYASGAEFYRVREDLSLGKTQRRRSFTPVYCEAVVSLRSTRNHSCRSVDLAYVNRYSLTTSSPVSLQSHVIKKRYIYFSKLISYQDLLYLIKTKNVQATLVNTMLTVSLFLWSHFSKTAQPIIMNHFVYLVGFVL